MRFKSREEAIQAHKHFHENTSMMDTMAEDRIERLLKEIIPGSRFLDVGCNDGQFSEYVKKRFKCDVYGVDVSVNARFWATFKGIKFSYAPVEDMPFKDDFFDMVNASEVLEHLYNLEDGVIEIHRVLKPGGKFIGTIPHPYVGIKEYEYHQKVIHDKDLKKVLNKYFKNIYTENIKCRYNHYNVHTGELLYKYKGKNLNIFFRADKP